MTDKQEALEILETYSGRAITAKSFARLARCSLVEACKTLRRLCDQGLARRRRSGPMHASGRSFAYTIRRKGRQRLRWFWTQDDLEDGAGLEF